MIARDRTISDRRKEHNAGGLKEQASERLRLIKGRRKTKKTEEHPGGKMKYTEGLKKNDDFRSAYKNGRVKSHPLLTLYVKENRTETNRLGVVVSKKVGNSVVRHRVKRLVKENYRLSEQEYKRGYDLIFVARPDAKTAGFYEIKEAVEALLQRMNLLINERQP